MINGMISCGMGFAGRGLAVPWENQALTAVAPSDRHFSRCVHFFDPGLAWMVREQPLRQVGVHLDDIVPDHRSQRLAGGIDHLGHPRHRRGGELVPPEAEPLVNQDFLDRLGVGYAILCMHGRVMGAERHRGGLRLSDYGGCPERLTGLDACGPGDRHGERVRDARNVGQDDRVSAGRGAAGPAGRPLCGQESMIVVELDAADGAADLVDRKTSSMLAEGTEDPSWVLLLGWGPKETWTVYVR
jgi:hypothetical protein